MLITSTLVTILYEGTVAGKWLDILAFAGGLHEKTLVMDRDVWDLHKRQAG
jgi:hypothetical protein